MKQQILHWISQNGINAQNYDTEINDFTEILHFLYPIIGGERIEQMFPEVKVSYRTQPYQIALYGDHWFTINYEYLMRDNDFTALVEFINETSKP